MLPTSEIWFWIIVVLISPFLLTLSIVIIGVIGGVLIAITEAIENILTSDD